MTELWVRFAVAALRPVERWHARRVHRAYERGIYRRVTEAGSGAVTTREVVR